MRSVVRSLVTIQVAPEMTGLFVTTDQLLVPPRPVVVSSTQLLKLVCQPTTMPDESGLIWSVGTTGSMNTNLPGSFVYPYGRRLIAQNPIIYPAPIRDGSGSG